MNTQTTEVIDSKKLIALIKEIKNLYTEKVLESIAFMINNPKNHRRLPTGEKMFAGTRKWLASRMDIMSERKLGDVLKSLCKDGYLEQRKLPGFIGNRKCYIFGPKILALANGETIDKPKESGTKELTKAEPKKAEVTKKEKPQTVDNTQNGTACSFKTARDAAPSINNRKAYKEKTSLKKIYKLHEDKRGEFPPLTEKEIMHLRENMSIKFLDKLGTKFIYVFNKCMSIYNRGTVNDLEAYLNKSLIRAAYELELKQRKHAARNAMNGPKKKESQLPSFYHDWLEVGEV